MAQTGRTHLNPDESAGTTPLPAAPLNPTLEKGDKYIFVATHHRGIAAMFAVPMDK
jgi:hypothetical protein